ncbi:hypothetical protein EZJ44_08110 [Arcanobacterium bovis]|uniref:Transposase n=1 Tax=Arcanobacterium bovis TaxID=2529275 RepID=A0A4Q9V0E1_9ACTO|nr:hypothetical protein EZJ44_08110 [Arcanobacterium bovis]
MCQDLANQHFTASKPNQLWVADITYVRILSGFVHTARQPRPSPAIIKPRSAKLTKYKKRNKTQHASVWRFSTFYACSV